MACGAEAWVRERGSDASSVLGQWKVRGTRNYSKRIEEVRRREFVKETVSDKEVWSV